MWLPVTTISSTSPDVSVPASSWAVTGALAANMTEAMAATMRPSIGLFLICIESLSLLSLVADTATSVVGVIVNTPHSLIRP